MRDQGRQEADHPDIGQQQAEGAVRSNGIEGGSRGAQTVGDAEQHADLIRDFERLGRRLHGMSVPDEQRIAKLRTQMPQHLADAGLRRCQQLCGPGDAAFVQQRVQDPQFSQVQFR